MIPDYNLQAYWNWLSKICSLLLTFLNSERKIDVEPVEKLCETFLTIG